MIMDDNFSSIVKAVIWGRSIFDNIRKFLQFQLTVNVVALVFTFVSALTGYELPLNAVMMLWVNLIMDTMGALALGTEPPSPTLLERKPYKRDASLISYVMIRNIAVQSLFQLALLTYLLLYGAEDFKTTEGLYNSTEPENLCDFSDLFVCVGSHLHLTIIFNTFVFCQIFNEFNARSIGHDCDVFKGLEKNPIFISIIAFTVLSQYLLVEYGGDWVRTVPLSPQQFYLCVILGGLTLSLGGLMRFIPVQESSADFAPTTEIMQRLHDKVASKKESSKTPVAMSPSFYVWFLAATIFPLLVAQSFGEVWFARIRGN